MRHSFGAIKESQGYSKGEWEGGRGKGWNLDGVCKPASWCSAAQKAFGRIFDIKRLQPRVDLYP
jgi:hypothetical protein